MSLARTAYRLRQFLASLGARPSPQEQQVVLDHLSQRQQQLFYSMTARDRRHCLDVFHALRRGGCEDAELLLAALLHDVGKGPVRLWHRGAYVLLSAVCPRRLTRLAQPQGRGWRRALASLHDHAARSAALAEQAGAPATVVELIRHHQRTDASDSRLALLRAADDSC
ncbi:MAG: HD domain-containing protein [Dehalococcoidia bacterium]